MTLIDTPKPADRTPGRIRARRSLPTLRTISALILREMVTSYGRSPGGYLWAILEPALGTALLIAIFSAGFKNPPMGSHFAMYYASGIVPFYFWMEVTNKTSTALQYSRPLLVYPSVTFLDAILARLFLTVTTQLLVAYCLFSFVILVLGAPVSLNAPRIALSFSMALALAVGLGTFNCYAFDVAPLWHRLYSIITRPLVFLSGVIFLHDKVPEPYRTWMEWNPLVHVVGMMRSGFYARYDAAYADPLYVFVVAIVLLAAGLLFLRRYHRDILNR